MNELRNKTAIISGGAEGIGLGLAKVFGEYGMNIVLADINQEQLSKAERELSGKGIPVLSVPLDVTKRSQWDNVAHAATERFGDIHMLVNNAGVGGVPLPLEMDDESHWRWVIDVNLLGVTNGMHAIGPLIKQHQQGGWVINVASMAGFVSLPMAGAYSASKAAVVAMTECWNQELKADNIHVAALCPGFVKTRINQSERNRQEDYVTTASAQSATSHPAMEGIADQMQAIIDAGTDPELIGRRVVEALEAGEVYIVTHSDYWSVVESRFEGIQGAFNRARDSELLKDVGEQRVPGFN